MALELTIDRCFELRRDESSGMAEWLAENPQTKYVFHMIALNDTLTLWECGYWETLPARFASTEIRVTGKALSGLLETTPARREWLEDGNR